MSPGCLKGTFAESFKILREEGNGKWALIKEDSDGGAVR